MAKRKACRCVELVNKQLSVRNARVEQRFMMSDGFGMSAPLVQLEKIDQSKRKVLPTVIASYCPFCGRKWE